MSVETDDQSHPACLGWGGLPETLRGQVADRFRVSVEDLVGRGQKGRINEARQELAFRLWTECRSLSLKQVAKVIGRLDHSAAIHCILAGARSRGIMAARVSDLREANGDDIDWNSLSHAVARARERLGLSLDRAARRAGVSRTVWRKAESGKSVSAGAVLRLCRAASVDPMSLIVLSGEENKELSA